MLWLLALGKLAAGWLVAWLLYQAVVRLVLPLVGKSKDRRQMLRTAVQALMLFAWTVVAVWAWEAVPQNHEGIGDQVVYGLPSRYYQGFQAHAAGPPLGRRFCLLSAKHRC